MGLGAYEKNYLDVAEAQQGGTANTQIRHEIDDICKACERIATLLDRVVNEAIPQDGSSAINTALDQTFSIIKNEVLLTIDGQITPIILAWEMYATHINAADMKG